MMRVIVNPISGGGRGMKLVQPVQALLRENGCASEVRYSERPGHITLLMREAVEAGLDGAVLVGGDGTVFEAANGLGEREPAAPFPIFFVPCGTGNDFIKALSLPADPIEALRAQFKSPARPLDVGRVNDLRFLNVSGSGFDIEVLRQTLRFKKRFSGLFAYLLGLIAALKHFKPLMAHVEIDGAAFDAPLTIIEVANGQYIGGGMRVVPMADPGDGTLNVVWVDQVSKITICRILPRFITGSYIGLSIAHTARAQDVVITCPGMTLNVDGELIETDRAHYRLEKGRILAHYEAVKAYTASKTAKQTGIQTAKKPTSV